jgi:putative redox protein
VKPPVQIELTWDERLRFAARSGSVQLVLDGDSEAGPSPMQALAAALAGCMAVDVVAILEKGRHRLNGMQVTLRGTRADGPPARFTAIDMHYAIEGEVSDHAVTRAIQLSREKYCSVWHSLRPDITLTTSHDVRPIGR